MRRNWFLQTSSWVPTVFVRVLFVFVILSHDPRRPVNVAVTEYPTSEWTARQLLEALRTNCGVSRVRSFPALLLSSACSLGSIAGLHSVWKALTVIPGRRGISQHYLSQESQRMEFLVGTGLEKVTHNASPNGTSAPFSVKRTSAVSGNREGSWCFDASI
jgi:hypothetical protein